MYVSKSINQYGIQLFNSGKCLTKFLKAIFNYTQMLSKATIRLLKLIARVAALHLCPPCGHTHHTASY